MIPGGSLLSIRSLHPYSCLWAGFTYKNDLIRLLVLALAHIHPQYIYIYIYRQREEEEVMTGLMIIHFPKREAFYSHTNSWSIIHDTLNSLIKKKLYISRTWLEFSIFVYWIRQGHDTWSKIKMCYNPNESSAQSTGPIIFPLRAFANINHNWYYFFITISIQLMLCI